MHLQDIFDQLVYGEFAQTNIGMPVGTDTVGGFQPQHYPSIISQINLALVDLYTRFNLKSKELHLQQFEGITLYDIHSDFAVSNDDSFEAYRYIIDTPDKPFTDDIVKIEQIFDEAECEIKLNDPDNNESVFTPEFTKLHIPYPSNEKSFSILYRALHPKLDVNTLDPHEVNIELPRTHLKALLYNVASRYYMGMPTMADKGEGANYLNLYEMECNRLSNEGLDIQDDPTNEKACDRGFV